MGDNVLGNDDYNLSSVTANDMNVITLKHSFYCHVKLFKFVLIYFATDATAMLFLF